MRFFSYFVRHYITMVPLQAIFLKVNHFCTTTLAFFSSVNCLGYEDVWSRILRNLQLIDFANASDLLHLWWFFVLSMKLAITIQFVRKWSLKQHYTHAIFFDVQILRCFTRFCGKQVSIHHVCGRRIVKQLYTTLLDSFEILFEKATHNINYILCSGSMQVVSIFYGLVMLKNVLLHVVGHRSNPHRLVCRNLKKKLRTFVRVHAKFCFTSPWFFSLPRKTLPPSCR